MDIRTLAQKIKMLNFAEYTRNITDYEKDL